MHCDFLFDSLGTSNYSHTAEILKLITALSFVANTGQVIHQLLVIQALRPDRLTAMGHRVVGTILGENFMHDAEQGLNLAAVVEHEVRSVKRTFA